MRIQSGWWSVRRTVATATVLLLTAFALPTVAGADSTVGAGLEAVTSGSWAATASPASLTFTSDATQSSVVANVGTLGLSAVSFEMTISLPATGAPTFTVFVCDVPWSSGSCAGGPGTEVGGTFSAGTTTTATTSVVPPLGGSVDLLVVPTSVVSSVTVTLGTSIDAAQLRSPLTTNQ